MDLKVENLVKYKITAQVVDRESGAQKFENIQLVRLKSIDHNLLIMEDFMPVIGEVKGFVELVSDDYVEKFENIHGFYMHKQNVFSLLIESHNYIVDLGEETAEQEPEESSGRGGRAARKAAKRRER